MSEGNKLESQKQTQRNGAKDTNNPSVAPRPESKKESITGKKQEFELNDFFWDDVIYYASSAMIVLTLLDLLSTFLGDSVQCYVPTDNFTFSQEQFVNSYCAQFTRPTDFFPFYLVVQVTFIYGVHFLWYSWFSGKFKYFVSLATSLARHRDSLVGKYPLENFVTLRALLSTYESSQLVLTLYMAKSFVQLFSASVSIYFNFDSRIFGDYNATYDCPHSQTTIGNIKNWPLGEGNITCVLSSLVVLKAVQWLNLMLLTGIIAMVVWGLLWMLSNHQSQLNWFMVAKFCLESGLPASAYVPKKWQLRYFNKRYFLKYRIRTDFHFMFLKLHREDAGHAKVLWDVLVDESIDREQQRQLERLSLWRQLDREYNPELIRQLEEKIDPKLNAKVPFVVERTVPYNENLGNSFQLLLANLMRSVGIQRGPYRPDVMDITFGNAGYKVVLASRTRRVVSVDLNPHYFNTEEAVRSDVYTAEVNSFVTFANVFAENQSTINKFRQELAKAYYNALTPPDNFDSPQNQGPITRGNFILVGPIPVAEREGQDKDAFATSVHWLVKWMRDYQFLEEKSYLFTVFPLAVEGDKSIQKRFVEFQPSWNHPESPISLYQRDGHNVASENGDKDEGATKDGRIKLRCGWTNCEFRIKVFTIPQLWIAK